MPEASPPAVTAAHGARARPTGRVHRYGWYGQLLRLRRLPLHPLMAVLCAEGSLVIGVLLWLADATSAWGVPAVPVLVGLGVKVQDVVCRLTAPDAENPESCD